MTTFNCPKLNQSFSLAKPVLDKITEIKNMVSADIKQLEQYLQSTGINETFEYIVTDPYKASGHKYFCENGPHAAIGSVLEEALVWDGNKKRIIFFKNIYEATFYYDAPEYPTVNIDSRNTVIEKPLIETSFDIRKRIYEEDHLVNFLVNITKKYDVKNLPK